jgi:hypothetical protein
VARQTWRWAVHQAQRRRSPLGVFAEPKTTKVVKAFVVFSFKEFLCKKI